MSKEITEKQKIEFVCKVCRAKQQYVKGYTSRCAWSIIGELCPWLKETLEREKNDEFKSND